VDFIENLQVALVLLSVVGGLIYIGYRLGKATTYVVNCKELHLIQMPGSTTNYQKTNEKQAN
jgi:hypothetical protein